MFKIVMQGWNSTNKCIVEVYLHGLYIIINVISKLSEPTEL